MIALRNVVALLATLLLTMPSTAKAVRIDSAVIVSTAEAHKPTVARWTRAVAAGGLPSTSYIFPWSKDRLHSNGHRDVILMIPQSAIPDQLTLVIWFHGLGGFSDRTFQKRILPQVSELVREDNHSLAIAIVEMPWSINTRTPGGRQGRVFQQPGHLTDLVDQLLDRLATHFAVQDRPHLLGPPRIAVVGHSAGGSAIMSASESGDLCEIGPSNVVWSDASYGPWLKRAWTGCLGSAREIETEVIVRKGGTPHRRALQFQRLVGEQDNLRLDVLPRKEWTHRRIGDSILWLSKIFGLGC
jgi:hypothetical protein